ncbi:MAG: hypothetical protein WCJ74_03675 [bacterium]
MPMDKEALKLLFPSELIEHFELVLVHELGHVEAKEDFIEVVFEEKNILPDGYSVADYESKGFYSKQIQDFPIRGKAVFLHVRRRVWRHKITKETITKDFTFMAEGAKFTAEMAAFLKEIGRDEA